MKKGVLSIEGFDYNNNCSDNCDCGVKAVKKRHSIIREKTDFFDIGNGLDLQLNTDRIKNAIYHMLKNYDHPTLMFIAHGRQGFNKELLLVYDDVYVSSTEILDFIKKNSKDNHAVDCGFFSCWAGDAFKGLRSLPPDSCMVSLCSNNEYNYNTSTQDFHHAIARTKGEFSLKNAFIEYLRSSSYKTGNPTIGMPSKGILQIPRTELNKGKEQRIELSNRVADFMK